MIDIVQLLREQHPDLGPYVIALRPGSATVAPDAPDRLSAEVHDWASAEAPSATLSHRPVQYAPMPGDSVETRTIAVLAFGTAAELARFATRWT